MSFCRKLLKLILKIYIQNYFSSRNVIFIISFSLKLDCFGVFSGKQCFELVTKLLLCTILISLASVYIAVDVWEFDNCPFYEDSLTQFMLFNVLMYVCNMQCYPTIQCCSFLSWNRWRTNGGTNRPRPPPRRGPGRGEFVCKI